ncbi:MAG: hypothetical protein N2Z74_02045 [Syntrophales bacterium]|nr:hypothetical protein [Syntrophales bacterium]
MTALSLDTLTRIFAFTPERARVMMDAFHGEMRRGLTGEGGSLPMLPAYVPRPRGDERGTYLVIDLGGTNIRIMTVRLDGRGGAVTAAVRHHLVPPAVMAGPGTALFDLLAAHTAAFVHDHRIPEDLGLAFTFSFPFIPMSVRTGRLIRWTKGYTCADTIGKDVTLLLHDALRRRGLPELRVAALTNDTVATLMAAAYGDPTGDVGVIVGTGTNACYVEEARRITGYAGAGEIGEVIVNTEWGSFDGLDATIYDRLLDKASPNPGAQLLEKQVSAPYVAELVRLILADMADGGVILPGKKRAALDVPYSLRGEVLAAAEAGEDLFARWGIEDAAEEERQMARQVCRLVCRRSARVVATALAAVLTWRDAPLAGHHTVAVDGALYGGYPPYEGEFRDMLRSLFGERAGRITICYLRNASGIGAAVTAAVAERMEGNA